MPARRNWNIEVSGGAEHTGMPAAHLDRSHKALVAAFNDLEVKAAMAKQENFINPTTPDAAAKFLKSEQDRYARLVAKANIKLD